MIVADTNTVSEFLRDAPNLAVLAWARTLEPADITISVVTVEEIERGLGCLPDGRRRRDPEHRRSALPWASSCTPIASHNEPESRAELEAELVSFVERIAQD